jgi:hypothetical protein
LNPKVQHHVAKTRSSHDSAPKNSQDQLIKFSVKTIKKTINGKTINGITSGGHVPVSRSISCSNSFQPKKGCPNSGTALLFYPIDLPGHQLPG